jgi:hypothetical protein
MTKQKNQHVDHLAGCCEHSITIEIECSICGSVHTEYIEDEDEVPGYFFGQAAQKAYNDGWRYDTSSVFNQIGPLCPECFEHKDDEEYFDD